MSGLTRKLRTNLGRMILRGLPAEKQSEVTERYINRLLEVIDQGAVVVPTGEKSIDPEDGELLVSDGALWFAHGGSYHQLWPI